MDDFDVRAKSADILEPSHLVDEMQHQASQYDSFPVIINGIVRTFHDVRGGYDEDGEYHLVKLVQKHDNMASTPDAIDAAAYEAHLNDAFWLYTSDKHTFNNEAEFVLALKVDDYEQQQYSFRAEMEQPADKRETGYTWVQE